MRRPAAFFRGGRFFLRYHSSTSPEPSTLAKGLQERLPSLEKWKRAWQYFLWVPAIIFINDHVISISPVNGISMRPTVNTSNAVSSDEPAQSGYKLWQKRLGYPL